MLHVTIQPNYGLVILEPEGPLTEEDFNKVARIVDPYIEDAGGLKGLVILTENFPGWESFSALIHHVKFVKNHHEYIERIAMVTNSLVGNFASVFAGHFVKAELKLFSFNELDDAKEWILAK